MCTVIQWTLHIAVTDNTRIRCLLAFPQSPIPPPFSLMITNIATLHLKLWKLPLYSAPKIRTNQWIPDCYHVQCVSSFFVIHIIRLLDIISGEGSRVCMLCRLEKLLMVCTTIFSHYHMFLSPMKGDCIWMTQVTWHYSALGNLNLLWDRPKFWHSYSIHMLPMGVFLLLGYAVSVTWV